MNRGDYTYVRQAPAWPTWGYELTALVAPMDRVSRAQGVLLGRLADVDPGLRDATSLRR